MRPVHLVFEVLASAPWLVKADLSQKELKTAHIHTFAPLQVFEVLASVPWLDEDDLSQKELKGVARMGLLGTLEEVGFNIRTQEM
eukprot:365667-Chlamydomonas_euryale.AAC.2